MKKGKKEKAWRNNPAALWEFVMHRCTGSHVLHWEHAWWACAWQHIIISWRQLTARLLRGLWVNDSAWAQPTFTGASLSRSARRLHNKTSTKAISMGGKWCQGNSISPNLQWKVLNHNCNHSLAMKRDYTRCLSLFGGRKLRSFAKAICLVQRKWMGVCVSSW